MKKGLCITCFDLQRKEKQEEIVKETNKLPPKVRIGKI